MDLHSRLEPLHMDDAAFDKNQEAHYDYDYTVSANPTASAQSDANTGAMPHFDTVFASATARAGASVNANVSASAMGSATGLKFGGGQSVKIIKNLL